MKRIYVSVLIILAAMAASGCQRDDGNISSSESINVQISQFEAAGVTEEYYNDTKELIDSYSSEEMKSRIDNIFSEFGSETYNGDQVVEDIQRIREELKADYYDLFQKCEIPEDKEMVLFGYHYNVFWLISYQLKAMNSELTSYTRALEQYYGKFETFDSTDLFDEFRTYITEKNITVYYDTLELD